MLQVLNHLVYSKLSFLHLILFTQIRYLPKFIQQTNRHSPPFHGHNLPILTSPQPFHRTYQLLGYKLLYAF